VYGDSVEGIAFRDADLEQRPYLFECRMPHYVGVECSTARVVVFLEAFDDGRTAWVTREFYWDSGQEGRQSDVLADLLRFIEGSRAKSRPRVILKEGAAGLSERLFGRGLWVTEQDENDEAVISGIRAVSSAFGRKFLRVHESCTNTLRELQLYRWDADKSTRGVEQPEKRNSFSCDALRRVAAEVFQPWRMTLEQGETDGQK
jgi:hypothetical protein